MWLPLHDDEPEMGDLELAVGTHAGPIGDAAISDEADAFYDRYLAVADIPRTKSGKIVELAVRDVVHGRAVKNMEALANPEALALYRDLPELKL